jgi:hypothetical protein
MVKAARSTMLFYDDIGGYHAWIESMFRQYCDYIKALGMDYIFIHSVSARHDSGIVEPDGYNDQQLEGILSVCDEKGIRVAMGTHWMSYGWVTNPDYTTNEVNFQQELQQVAATMERLYATFNQHPSFTDWMVVPEMGVLDVYNPRLVDLFQRYWTQVSAHSHGKPVYVATYSSPEYGDDPLTKYGITPTSVQYGWQSILTKAGIKGGVIWVDSGGAQATWQEFSQTQKHKRLDDYYPAFKEGVQSAGATPIIQCEIFLNQAGVYSLLPWDQIKPRLDYELSLTTWLQIYAFNFMSPILHPINPVYPEYVKYIEQMPEPPQPVPAPPIPLWKAALAWILGLGSAAGAVIKA